MLNLLKKPDADILDLASKFSQGQLQTELNQFVSTVTQEVGEGHTGQQAVQQVGSLTQSDISKLTASNAFPSTHSACLCGYFFTRCRVT
jgi:hypothetical protein